MKKLIIGTIVLTLLLIMAGCEEEFGDYSGSDYLVSGCQWRSCLDADFLEQILFLNNIDPNDKWCIECPLCKTAFIEKTKEGGSPYHHLIICNFCFVPEEYIFEPPMASAYYDYFDMLIYCSGCLYPLGMDWIDNLNAVSYEESGNYLEYNSDKAVQQGLIEVIDEAINSIHASNGDVEIEVY